MSKILKCREVGMNCDFEARAETEQEVMQQAVEHARSVHGMTEIPAEVQTKVREAIHEDTAARM